MRYFRGKIKIFCMMLTMSNFQKKLTRFEITGVIGISDVRVRVPSIRSVFLLLPKLNYHIKLGTMLILFPCLVCVKICF